MAEADLRLLLKTVADTTGAQQTTAALRQVTQQAETTTSQTENLGRAVAATAAGYLSLQAVVQAASAVFSASINVARENERVVRATAAAYGQQAKEFERFAATLSSTTGFTSQAILEAALSARTLSANYGLTIQQTQKLITVSADLAKVRGIGIAESFERVQSAIRGEAEASEYLGLTLNDTYIRNQALNGSLKGTFETMTDTEKAQIRYNELLRQAGVYTGLAATKVDSLDAAFLRAETSANKLALAIGNLSKGPTIGALDFISKWLEGVGGNTQQDRDYANDAAGLRKFFDELGRGAALVPAIDAGLATAEAARVHAAASQDELRRQEIEAADALIRNEGQRQPGAGDTTLARVAALDQRKAAVRDLVQFQRDELAIQTELNRLHGEEAQALLQVLPARQQIAQLEREITDQVDRRVQLSLEAQRIAAEQRAAPVQAALEDTERAMERARLVLGIRGTSAEERSAARRQIRDLTRNVAPGQRLAAFDAETPLLGLTREQRAFDLSTRAGQIPLEQRLAGLQAGARPGEDALLGIQQSIQNQEALANVAAARTDAQQQVLAQIIQQAILDGFIKRPPTQIQIQVLTPDGQVSYQELIEATDQAAMPPVVRVSGVRR